MRWGGRNRCRMSYQDPGARALQDDARQLRDRTTAAKTEAERAYLQRQPKRKSVRRG